MNSENRGKKVRRQMMLRAVQEQMASAQTPEVREHYHRLRSLGHTDEEAQELIATALACYIWHTMRRDDYTYRDYVADLVKLPRIEWLDDEKEG